ncbi:helix-turn-helix domain-containing protein [Roseovarius sp. EL26]|uniref:MerR family transcriptional regulator n=1 Tax=Roseovarius sp. EL26 TaxID=2126672 RepID=UPI000EA234E0|nr:helix-turn-helix domain-containing protein [Roseovarius sp. EL26]
MFSIGQLSKRTGVKVPTIRYYEEVGLLASQGRSAGNQRRYSRDGLQRLSFIRHSRDLGFSLDDIRELIELSQNPETPCGTADTIANRHLEEVRDRIEKLMRLEKELLRITACNGHNVGECAVIETLADHSLCETDH